MVMDNQQHQHHHSFLPSSTTATAVIVSSIISATITATMASSLQQVGQTEEQQQQHGLHEGANLLTSTTAATTTGATTTMMAPSTTTLIIRHHPDPPLPDQKPIFLLSPIWLAENFVPVQEMLSWLLNGPLTLLFVLSGIALNALCVLVFLRFRNTGGSTTTPIIHYYLVALACWHSALLCNAFVLYCLPTLLWGSVVSSGPYVHLYPPTYTLANATHTGTVWIILALTLDRYLALCMPFKHRLFSKRSRVKRLVVGLSILAIVFSLPRFFEVSTAFDCPIQQTSISLETAADPLSDAINNVVVINETDQDNQPNDQNGNSDEKMETSTKQPTNADCVAYVQRTGLPQNSLYRTFYHILLGSAFVTILPGILTFVLTLRITIALSEAQRRRKRLSHCETLRSSETKTTNTTTTTTTATTTTTTGTTATVEKESHSNGRDTMDENNSGGSYNTAASLSEKQQYRTLLLGAVKGTNGGGAKKPAYLKRKEHRANVMLVVIIVKFLISDILPTVLDVFETFIGNEAFMSSPVATLWVDFSNLLLVLNCSTNFWVFIFYVRGFRQRCARLLAISLRLAPAPMDGNESVFVPGSGVASPRPSTPYCLMNGPPLAALPTTATLAQRGRGSAGDYTELAINAMLNSCSSSTAPILPVGSRDASLHSLQRINAGLAEFQTRTNQNGISSNNNNSRGGSPLPGIPYEINNNNNNKSTGNHATATTKNSNRQHRSERASSLSVTAQHRTSTPIGVTITPPTPAQLLAARTAIRRQPTNKKK